jgi:excisionase family DNA binding protein
VLTRQVGYVCVEAVITTVPEEESDVAQRFLQLAEVSEILNISSAQAYALVRSGELPAIKIGGRGQ